MALNQQQQQQQQQLQTLTLMLITSKHHIGFKQVSHPLNFFCPKGLPIDI